MCEESLSFPPYPTEPSGHDETVEVRVGTSGGNRVFELTTTAARRDNPTRHRRIGERPADPRILTGSPLFDALFAQAIDDARLNAVSSIRDGAYRHGEPIPCDCFQTGEKWTYVWTRDVSYATHLGLAVLDPERAAITLLYKVSPFRDGLALPDGLPVGSLQIIQDTGSGGSWPVSTDRVSWAFGAEALLATLHGTAHAAFADTAFRALSGTIEADRLAAFDPADGLYRGEQSFLDWRDQTYAPWVIDDLTTIATSKALSTNACHFKALDLAARLAAERGDTAAADRYAGWAADLRAAVDRGFWLEEKSLYASITTPDSPARPVETFDMLGLSLAILTGIAGRERARRILSAYPHVPFGAPVYYPAQPDVFCYHNRAIWPFVTAYELLAAVEVETVAAFDHAFESLVRAAALNLDNVENQEWLTGRTWFDDGPCISSARQLWSVGGYLGMVMTAIFGYRPAAEGFRIAPFLTAHVRDRLGDGRAELHGLVHHGRRIAIALNLPPRVAGQGHYALREVRLNGAPVTGLVADASLRDDNTVDVTFGDLIPDDAGLSLIPVVEAVTHDDPRVFSPREPLITDLVVEDGRVRLNFEGQPPRSGRREALLFTVLRDGEVAAADLSDTVWHDPVPLRPGIRRAYRVVARFEMSGNASHPSLEAAIEADAVLTIGVDGAGVERRDGRLIFADVAVREAGDYRLALLYRNHSFHIQTGVTNAVKRVEVFDAEGRPVASGIVQMPHMTPVNPRRRSTFLPMHLRAGRYRIEIDDFFNMSYLSSNATYISPGGMSGPHNKADIRALDMIRSG
ncbi:conserved hypothetical protein [uncultured Pleomorphomonas sp.]|uniref:Mannosylglycerate hydrolase MGH1-like glycoside hydrolase domain-containing protein n=1 Tax=uncultured Pleomorphomonas sp. TaxID=442121 RepID=A0A212LIR5_9HYPH|nr:hypothetical protein [uncultured Pleomorphomonas sp.]SCM77442.1 conserved hypothetical protein [uncultured Pleomorphomonas sp.]